MNTLTLLEVPPPYAGHVRFDHTQPDAHDLPGIRSQLDAVLPAEGGQTGSFVKPLALVPDEQDLAIHRQNSSAELITHRLRELISLFEFTGCAVEIVSPERTVLTAPLLPAAMNQNGTQQGAVFYLLAEYTLGVGMFAALPGIYAVGVHDRCRALPVQCWLKRNTVQHLVPGTGPLRAIVEIAPEQARAIRQQLLDKGRCELGETVRIYQGDRLVASAEPVVGMYADVPRQPGVRASAMQVQNLKTSALMIAGLREDPLSQAVAQDQGQAIAQRMAAASPQLPALIRARTTHLEAHLRQAGANYDQVVVLGVGLDTKPVTFSNERQHWFGLDLRDMLRERELRFTAAAAVARNFTAIPTDFRSPRWEAALVEAGFQPDASTLFIAEGISMYLFGEELARMLTTLRTLSCHRQTRVWIDHVTPDMFSLDLPEVRAFLSTMNRLGEPFVLGFENPERWSGRSWELAESTSAAAVLGVCEAVHGLYRFSLLEPAKGECSRETTGRPDGAAAGCVDDQKRYENQPAMDRHDCCAAAAKNFVTLLRHSVRTPLAAAA